VYEIVDNESFFIVQHLENIHQDIVFPLVIRLLLHILQQEQRQLSPDHQADRPNLQRLDIVVLEDTLDQRVSGPLEGHVLLCVGTHPLLLLDHVFGCVLDEVGRTGHQLAWLEVEGSEHAESGSPENVDLHVLVFLGQHKSGLPDGINGSGGVPQKGVIDHPRLLVHSVPLVLVGHAEQQQHLGFEFPHLDYRRLHAV